MGKFKKGQKPWNWRGHPIVEPRGYILIHVGKEHPLADVRGYAYEHRLKMFETGKLDPNELTHVHHGDGLANTEANLEVLTPWGHRAKHRKRYDRGLQEPDTPNVMILCECGCGAEFEKYDVYHRPRRFIPGHNPIQAPAEEQLLELLRTSGRSLSNREIEKRTGRGMVATKCLLSRLKKRGKVTHRGRALWSI